MCRAQLSPVNYNNAIYWGLAVNYIYIAYLVTLDSFRIASLYNIKLNEYITEKEYKKLVDEIKQSPDDLKSFVTVEKLSTVRIQYIKREPGELINYKRYFYYFNC